MIVPARIALAVLAVFCAAVLLVVAYLGYLWLNATRPPDYPLRRGELASTTLIARQRIDGGRIEQIRLRSTTGIEFEVALRIPDRPLPQRPLVVLLAGNETGHRAATMIREPGGTAVAALSYPFKEIPYQEFWPMLRALPDIQRGIIDTPAAVLLAIDYLQGRADLRPQRIELAGVSFGSYLVPAAAGFEPRIDRLWLIHGSADPEGVIRHGLAQYLPWPALAAPLAWYLAHIAGAEFLAPELWIDRLKSRDLVVVSARSDDSLPMEAVRLLHDRVPAGTPVLWTPGRHVHPERPEVMDLLSRQIRAHIEDSVRVEAAR